MSSSSSPMTTAGRNTALWDTRILATPNLDRLAAESLTFKRGYSPVPLCRPSLASIATGLYPHQHGVTGNDPDLPDKGANAMAGRGNPNYARYYQTIIENFRRQPNLVRDLTGRGYVPCRRANGGKAIRSRPPASPTP